MINSFIPALHLDTAPQDKLKPEWCLRALQYYYFNTYNQCLLHDKNVREIEEYVSGDIDMKPFKAMFKSMKRKEQKKIQEKGQKGIDWDTTDMQFTPLPLIPTPINSAVEIINKIPVEVSCTALDPLAATKRKEDVTFLKNKPQIEDDLKQVTDKMGITPLDLGGTQHASVSFSDSPYGLNLNDPEDFDVFVNLLYRLGVESCFETILQAWWDLRKVQTNCRRLEIIDHFKFGVSCNTVSESHLTWLPAISYEYPGRVFTPKSELPDFSDNSHRYIKMSVTPIELFDLFGDEICNKETLMDIVLGSGSDDYSYCGCNENIDRDDLLKNPSNFNAFKMTLLKFEVKSIDWVGKMSNPKSKKGFAYLSSDPLDNETCTGKIWGQNTYVFYWLINTKKVFGIHRLGYSHRTVGIESYQNFSTNIYRSQYRSAVENSIAENKKAQVADIKMQFEIIQARPSGIYIDLKYVREAVTNLVEDSSGYTIDDVIEMILEKNVMLGDSTGMDGANEGQFLPFKEIPGGLKGSVEGYLKVIFTAIQNIATFTGINQQLTGQGQDPNALIGVEKIRLNSSLNALHYANTGIETQYENVFNQWSYCFQQAIKRGGKAKEAVTSIIGSRKVDIIDRINEVPIHQLGIKVRMSLREEDRQKYEQRKYILESAGILTSADIYMLDYIPNIKDRWALLAVREKQFRQRQQAEQQRNFENQQAISKQNGQNMVAQENASAEGKIKQVYAQGDVKSKLVTLQNQLDTHKSNYDALLQKSLEQEKTQGQIKKALQTIQAKADAANQQAYTS